MYLIPVHENNCIVNTTAYKIYPVILSGTVPEPGKPVVQVTAAYYQQQAQESPGALTGRTIQINVPLPASSTSHIDNHEQNKTLEQSNVNVDDRKPVVQKLQQDWDSD